jgi:hypothetical protein
MPAERREVLMADHIHHTFFWVSYHKKMVKVNDIFRELGAFFFRVNMHFDPEETYNFLCNIRNFTI